MSQVEIDEVLRLVGNEAPEIASHDAVPGRALPFIERTLDVLSNVLLDSVLAHGFLGNIYCLLLHVLRHICRLDLGFELVTVSSRRGRLLFSHVRDWGCEVLRCVRVRNSELKLNGKIAAITDFRAMTVVDGVCGSRLKLRQAGSVKVGGEVQQHFRLVPKCCVLAFEHSRNQIAGCYDDHPSLVPGT